MGIFKKLFASGNSEEEKLQAIEEPALDQQAEIAAIAAALDAFFAEKPSSCGCKSGLQTNNTGINPWCLKAYGLRSALGNRNPWLQKIHFPNNALTPVKH